MKPASILPRAGRALPAFALASFLSFAAAQVAPPPAAEIGPPGDWVVMSPFRVTGDTDEGYRSENSVAGTKTNVPIRQTPQSIQVVNRSFIDDQQAQIMADALRYTSGVTEGNNPRGDRFEMRGFTTGIPFKNGFRDTGRAPRDTANFERIEVAKGPASVIMSRTSPGGSMNILSKQPRAAAAYVLGVQFGSHDFYRATVDATGPVGTDRLLYRLNAAWQDSGSFRDTFFIERTFASPIVTFQATPSLALVFELEHLEDRRRPDSGIVAVGTAPAPVAPGTYYGEDFAFNKALTLTHRYEALYTRERISARLAFRRNQTNERGDTVTLTGVAGNGQSVNRRVDRNTNWVENDYFQSDFLFDFATGPAQHKSLVGFEYGSNTDGGRQQRAALAPIAVANPARGAVPGAFAPFSHNSTTTWFREYYAQHQVFLFEDRLTLLAGARFAEFAQRTTNFVTGAVSRAGGDAPNPRIGIVWLPRENVSLYAVRSDIQVPSTITNPDGTVFDPVTSELHEAGVRLELADKRYTVTASYFDLVQNNVLQPDPVRPGFLLQTGESTSRGFEVDLTATPAPGWQILGSAAWTTAEISGDVNPARLGLRLPNTPRRTLSVWNRYTFEAGAAKGLGVGVGVIHVGQRAGDANNSFFVDAYTRVDLMLDYPYRRWSFSLNVRNALDTDYIESAAARLSIMPGAPRNLLARATLRF